MASLAIIRAFRGSSDKNFVPITGTIRSGEAGAGAGELARDWRLRFPYEICYNKLPEKEEYLQNRT